MTDSQLKQTIAELERKNQELQNAVELARNELSHKTAILSQTSTELSELQTQYKQVLQKLVDMSQRSGSDLTSEEERIYRAQLYEQSMCIATLEDRVWKSEHSNRLYKVHGYKYPKEACSCNKMSDLRREIEMLKKENRKWSEFGSTVCSIVGIPDDYTMSGGDVRRSILRKLEKHDQVSDAEYSKLKKKYDRSQEYIREIQARLDRMTRARDVEYSESSSVCGCRGALRGFGENVARLNNITKQIKGDYRHLASRADYSIESLSELNTIC